MKQTCNSLIKNLTVFIITFSAISAIIASPVSSTIGHPIIQTDNETYTEPLTGEAIINENNNAVSTTRIETFTIEIPQLGNRDRSIIIYLPSDYDNNISSYPVLYLQGAQDVFVRYDEIFQEWLINQALLDFFSAGIEGEAEAIIVGILYDPIHKWDEFSPWVNNEMYRWMHPYDANRVEGGDGDAYLEFLINTLKPSIDGRYRTLQDQEYTFIGGYDTGGLISLYAGLTRPDVFSKVMAMSPAVWFAEDGGSWLSRNRLIDLIHNSDISKDVTFFIDVAVEDRTSDLVVRPAIYDSQGKKIDFPRAYLEGAYQVASALIDRGHPQNLVQNHVEFQVEWVEELFETSRSLPEIYYFPLFLNEKPSQFHYHDISMDPPLSRTRRVWVYLPPNYDPNFSEGYQVIYITSAQDMFGVQTGAYLEPGGDWKFDETLDALYYETRVGTIAVGIEYDFDNPWDQYLPWDNLNFDNWWYPEPTVVYGKGDIFLDYIENNVKNFIDATYNTKPGPEYTAIGGGSRHGLFALYACLTRPDTFSKAMAMSPAIWMAEGGERSGLGYPRWFTTNQLGAWLDSNQSPTNVKYFIHIGTNEITTMPFPPYPYAYLEDGGKVGWDYVYQNGADQIVSKIEADLPPELKGNVEYHKTADDHTIPVWGKYVETALRHFGFYPLK